MDTLAGIANFFLFLIAGLFLLRLVWRWVGPWLLKRLAKRLARHMQAEMMKRQNAHQQQYDPVYGEEIKLSSDLKVSIPRADTPGNRNQRSQNAETVDFEDVE